MNLNKILKERRIKLGLTQQEVAEELHVARQTVSSWETGKNFPDIPTLVKISDYYALSLDYMLKGDESFMKKIEDDSKELVWLRKSKYIYIIIVTLVLLLLLLQFTQKSDGNTALWQLLYLVIRLCIIGVMAFVYLWFWKTKKVNQFVTAGFILLFAGMFLQEMNTILAAAILSLLCRTSGIILMIFGAIKSHEQK